MTAPSPTVTVVVATYRRPQLAARLLEALAKQTLPAETFEVIVVDDSSGDDTGEVVTDLARRLPFQVRLLRTAANSGAGAARNLGWRAAAAPIVAFTDDDCVPDPPWLAAGVAAFEADPGLGVVQGPTRPAEEVGLDSAIDSHSVEALTATPHFETCNIFYRRQALADGGGFGENHTSWGGSWCEDTFGGWRVLDAGWGRAFEPAASVAHDVTDRGLKWWVNKSLMLYVEVAVAAQHPGFRKEAYWHRWAPRREDAAYAVALVGLLAAAKWRPAALLAVPYVVSAAPSPREPKFLRRCARTLVVDTARAAGIAYGAARERIFVV